MLNFKDNYIFDVVFKLEYMKEGIYELINFL